jgi:hypothetical protein
VGGLFWMNGARFLDADTKAAALAAKNDRN